MEGSSSLASTWNGLRDIGMARMTGKSPIRRTFAMARTNGLLAVYRASCPFGEGVAIDRSECELWWRDRFGGFAHVKWIS